LRRRAPAAASVQRTSDRWFAPPGGRPAGRPPPGGRPGGPSGGL